MKYDGIEQEFARADWRSAKAYVKIAHDSPADYGFWLGLAVKAMARAVAWHAGREPSAALQKEPKALHEIGTLRRSLDEHKPAALPSIMAGAPATTEVRDAPVFRLSFAAPVMPGVMTGVVSNVTTDGHDVTAEITVDAAPEKKPCVSFGAMLLNKGRR